MPHPFWRITSFVWLVLLMATPVSLWLFDLKIFAALVTLHVLAQTAVVVAALSESWRWSAILKVMAVILAISWGMEWLGTSTGIFFGVYTYTNALLPQFGSVPVVIPFAWAMMLIPAWGIAQVILEPHQSRLGTVYPLLYAALSGLAFTAWDLYLDPQMVERGFWVWTSPGHYYGIPWLNYLGWWLISTLITLIIRPKNLPSAPLLLIYTITWLFQAIGMGIFTDQPGPALTGFIGMGIFTMWVWRQSSVPINAILIYLPFQPSGKRHSLKHLFPNVGDKSADKRLPSGDDPSPPG